MIDNHRKTHCISNFMKFATAALLLFKVCKLEIDLFLPIKSTHSIIPSAREIAG
jgi:hypothetical protein